MLNAKIDHYLFDIPEESTYAQFHNEEDGMSLHVFFDVADNSFRFTIIESPDKQPPEELAKRSYSINSLFSSPEWLIPPTQLKDSKSEGWICGYGLMKGKGLRIVKVFFKRKEKPVCLTFSSSPESFLVGYQVFEQIAQSFVIVDAQKSELNEGKSVEI